MRHLTFKLNMFFIRFTISSSLLTIWNSFLFLDCFFLNAHLDMLVSMNILSLSKKSGPISIYKNKYLSIRNRFVSRTDKIIKFSTGCYETFQKSNDRHEWRRWHMNNTINFHLQTFCFHLSRVKRTPTFHQHAECWLRV